MRVSFDRPPPKAPPKPAAPEFAPGYVVRLKSGGPDMTVSLLGRPFVFCVWFTEAECYGEDWFHEAALERSEGE